MSYSYARGMRSVQGLGDPAYDAALAAYQHEAQLWAVDKQSYDRALAAYQADQVRYANEQAVYKSKLAAYNSASVGAGVGYGMANAAAQKAYSGIVFPSGYAGCVTQAQHDAWQKTCDSWSSIKGLGGPAPTGPECGLARLPVCAVMPPAPAAPRPPQAPPPGLRPPPVAPAPPPASSTLPVPPQPQQQPTPTPTVISVPAPTPTSIPTPNLPTSISTPLTPGPTPASASSDPKSGAFANNGLLLLVLAGGGYALYRTFRKPKKAS